MKENDTVISTNRRALFLTMLSLTSSAAVASPVPPMLGVNDSSKMMSKIRLGKLALRSLSQELIVSLLAHYQRLHDYGMTSEQQFQDAVSSDFYSGNTLDLNGVYLSQTEVAEFIGYALTDFENHWSSEF